MARTASRDLWLCLLLPRLGVELFTRSLPDAAAQRPVVLVDGPRVVGLNATARARGLQPAMSLSTAESICADLAVARRHADLELRALERLAIRAYRFTPRVSPQPPDALLLEVAGSLRLFRGLDRLQRRVLEDVAGLGYSALPGLAPTPLAAGALARAGRSPDPDRLAATLAFDGRGDDALREAWCTAVADAARPALAGTALVHLDRPAAEQEKFEAMGLRTVGDLLRLPRGPLARRFGKALPEHLDRLTGRRPDPRETVTPPPLFASTVHFLEDVEHAAGLAFPMQRLVGELADWLRLRQLATDRLDWRLRHPRHGEQRLQVRFAGSQHESARFLEFSRLQLDRDPSLPAVASLELRVTRLTRIEGDAGALFAGPGEDGAAHEDPALLVDRLRARLGDAVCRSVLPADDHRPEHAWRPAPPRPPRPDGRTPPPRGAAPPEGPRPLWLVEPPQPLTDRDGRPFRNGPPRALPRPGTHRRRLVGHPAPAGSARSARSRGPDRSRGRSATPSPSHGRRAGPGHGGRGERHPVGSARSARSRASGRSCGRSATASPSHGGRRALRACAA